MKGKKVQNLRIGIWGRVMVWVINLYFILRRSQVRVKVLNWRLWQKSLQNQIVELEEISYTQANVSDSIEGYSYFAGFDLGLKLAGSLHIGIFGPNNLLVGYLSFLQPRPNQYLISRPGELLFGSAYAKWWAIGSPALPVIAYRKLMILPTVGRLLLKTGALRITLGLFTLLASAFSKKDWLLISQVQPDSVKVLLAGNKTMFPDTRILLNDEIPGKSAHILMAQFKSLYWFRHGAKLIQALSGLVKFTKAKKGRE